MQLLLKVLEEHFYFFSIIFWSKNADLQIKETRTSTAKATLMGTHSTGSEKLSLNQIS